MSSLNQGNTTETSSENYTQFNEKFTQQPDQDKNIRNASNVSAERRHAITNTNFMRIPLYNVSIWKLKPEHYSVNFGLAEHYCQNKNSTNRKRGFCKTYTNKFLFKQLLTSIFYINTGSKSCSLKFLKHLNFSNLIL
jgi:hypothetical protein